MKIITTYFCDKCKEKFEEPKNYPTKMVPIKILIGSVGNQEVYSSPYRSNSEVKLLICKNCCEEIGVSVRMDSPTITEENQDKFKEAMYEMIRNALGEMQVDHE